MATLVLCLALGTLYALRWQLLSGTVARLAERELGGLFSARVRVHGVAGSLLTSLELRGLDIQPGPGSPLAGAGRVGRLRLEYTPWLLLGDAAALSRVIVEDAELAFAPRGEAGADRADPDLRVLLAAARSLPGRPEVHIAGLDLQWGRLHAGGLTGRLASHGSAEHGRLDAELGARSLAVAGRDFGALSGRASLSWPGTSSDARLEADAEGRGGAVFGTLRLRLPLGNPAPAADCRVELDVRTPDLPRLLALPAGWDRLAGGLGRSAALRFSADGTLDTLSGAGWLELRPDRGDGANDGRGGLVPLSLANGRLAAAETALDVPAGRLHFGGALPLGLPWPASGGAAPAGEASGLRAELAAQEVASLARLLPERLREELLPLVPRAALRISARLRRGADGFEPTIEAAVRDGELRPGASLTPLTDVSLDLRLAAGELTLERAAARMELGELAATGRLRLADGRFDARISGRDLLVLDGTDGLRLRAGLALDLTGDPASATLSGRVRLPLVRYRREFAGGAAAADGEGGLLDRDNVILPLAMELPLARAGGLALPGLPGFAWLGLDVALDADGDVSIENSTVGALLAGRFRVRGTAAAPVLSGELEALSGEVRLFPGTFVEIGRCRVLLPETPGTGPQLDFASEMTVQRLRVFVSVTGPLAAPVLHLASSPPYSQDELLALLLYGRRPGSLTAGQAGSAALGQAGRVLGGLVMDRPPRARPERDLLSRLSLGYGSEPGPRPDGVLRRQTAGTSLFFAEYAINELLSIVTSRDGLGGVSVDLQARLRWPRPPRDPAGGGGREGAAAPDGGARPPVTKFTGNRAIRTARLMRAIAPDLARLGPEGWTAVAASDAADRLRQPCLDAGHFMARVSAAVAGSAAEFTVEEGPRVRVGRVDFVGNRGLSDGQLRAALFRDWPGLRNAPFTVRLLDAQVRSLLAFCREEGCLQASVDVPLMEYDPGRRRMNVTHRLVEGPRFVLGEVRVTGLEGEAAAAVTALARPFLGGPLRESVPGRLAAAVRSRYRELGHLRVDVAVERALDEATGLGRLTIVVRPGPRLRLAAVNVSGVRNSAPDFVRRLAGLRPGQVLTQSSLRRAERRLAESGAFRGLFYEIGETGPAGSVDGEVPADLALTVTEVEPYEAALRLGYGSFDGVRAGGELGMRNLFGRAEHVAMGGSLNQRGYRLYTTGSLPPWPGIPVTAQARAFFEEKEDISFSDRNYGVSPSLSLHLSPRDTLSGGLLFEWIATDGIPAGVPEGDLLDFKLAEAFVTVTHDRRDAPALARRGYLASCHVALADASAYGDISCTQLSGRLAGYLPLAGRLTLAASAQGRMIRPHGGTEEIPIALRLFGGGPDTVRGFRDRTLGPLAGDDPAGGELLLAGQSELRLRLWRSLYGAAFLDAGNVWSRVDGADLTELRWGLGPGVRYHTPAGAIGLDVGFNPDRRHEELSPVLHLTLGLSF
jgi:translocation and assembly module TamA